MITALKSYRSAPWVDERLKLKNHPEVLKAKQIWYIPISHFILNYSNDVKKYDTK